MAKVLTILLTAWSLLVTPSLCVAGVLQHQCDREATTGHEHEDKCPHESSCPQDPCPAPMITARQVQARGPDGMTSRLETSPLMSLGPAETVAGASRGAVDQLRPPLLKRLPFPASDIPLLI